MWNSPSSSSSSSPAREAKDNLGPIKRSEQAYRLENNTFAPHLAALDAKVQDKFYAKAKPSSASSYLIQLCQGDTALVERLTSYHKNPIRAIEVLLSDRGIGQPEIKAIIKDLA